LICNYTGKLWQPLLLANVVDLVEQHFPDCRICLEQPFSYIAIPRAEKHWKPRSVGLPLQIHGVYREHPRQTPGGYDAMFDWNRGKIRDESTVVHGARITPDNIWMAKALLSGNPERVKVTPYRYLVNRGTREEPVFEVVRQAKFVRV
jgi:hypothetical protein